MGHWPLAQQSGGAHETFGVTASASRGTTITASATANTKGTWTQLTAATARDAVWIDVDIHSATAARDYLLDIGIGAAGSEHVLIPDLIAGSGTGSICRGAVYRFPIFVPAGSRLAARCQSGTGSATIRVAGTLTAASFNSDCGSSEVTAYGALAASTAGTTVDPGATANTKGTWTEITAATSAPIRALVVGQGNLVQTTRTSCDWLLDIGIGPAGSEQVLIGDQHWECSTTCDTIVPIARPPYFVDIPAGTRLAARAACSITTATVRNLSTVYYGVA